MSCLSFSLLLESSGLGPTCWKRGLRNKEVKGDGKPGGTEAPLFGAQNSPGKGRAHALGRKGGSGGGGRGAPAGGTPATGPGGGQVPSRMPSGLTDSWAEPGETPPQSPRGLQGREATPTARPPPQPPPSGR